IGQQDGQTIFQSDIFGKHVKKSVVLPIDYEHEDSRWSINRVVNEAINLSMQEPMGPVHINVPFREPLYPEGHDATIKYSEDIRVIEEFRQDFSITPNQKKFIRQRLKNFHNILIVSGQNDYHAPLLFALENFTKQHNIPLVAEIISNLHPLEKVIKHADLFLGQASDDVKKTLQPDLLITFGKSVLSKNLKTFLRKYKPKEHWHFQPADVAADTFKNISHIFHTTPEAFFDFLSSLTPSETFENQKQNNYYKWWEIEERRLLRTMENFTSTSELGELELVKEIIRHLPDQCNLHLANSMSVRYANFIGLAAS